MRVMKLLCSPDRLRGDIPHYTYGVCWLAFALGNNKGAGSLWQKDFAGFDPVLLQAHERCPLRILAYCLMGNHWHFIA